MNTVEGSNRFPCNAVGGPGTGERCVFPWFFPDCSLRKPNGGCEAKVGKTAPIERQGCILEKRDDDWWCGTKTFHNRAGIDNLALLIIITERMLKNI